MSIFLHKASFYLISAAPYCGDTVTISMRASRSVRGLVIFYTLLSKGTLN